MPDDASTPLNLGSYTNAEVRVRILAYIWQGVLASLIGSITSMASMSDEQMAHITLLRWAINLSLLILGAALAGWNAFRAAIDRSTSSQGSPGSTPPTPEAKAP